MISLKALKDYIDAIRNLCSSVDDTAVVFFHSMEEKGIDILNDTETFDDN